jgi:hypothetical protein
MNAAVGLRTRVQEFLREQRNLGYRLVSCGRELLNFASFVEDSMHPGAVTVELTSQCDRLSVSAYIRWRHPAGLIHLLSPPASLNFL